MTVANGNGIALDSIKSTLIHRNSHSNQDVAFSLEDRSTYSIRGLLPPVIQSLDVQATRALLQLRAKSSNIEKYIFLSSMRQTKTDLFYKIVTENMAELTPLIYTPVVGEACQTYSEIYRGPEALYLSLADKGSIEEVLQNWPEKIKTQKGVAVVTDGSRILGLGDLGVGGVGISIGKLSLYVAGAGIDPESTIPIVLDMGTDNPKYLNDPLYLGTKVARRSIQENIEFMDEFMAAMKVVFPNMMVQFEDFASESAFFWLERYRHNYLVFNDDIQGTGAVILSGFINSARQSAAASGIPVADQKIVFLGAGSAAVGVAQQLISFFTMNGLTAEEGRKRIWLVDTKGLVTKDRGDKLAAHKVFFARVDNDGQQFKTLEEVVNYVKPTALVGLSTSRGAFTESVVKIMAETNKRPIIFPLSNPTSLCELDFEDALKWTNGSVIFSSGSPYAPITFDGALREAGQGNNMYIFPGLGLGTLLCGATTITDRMVEETALALAESLNDTETKTELVYPRITRIREISAQIALKVIRAAQKENVDTFQNLRSLTDAELYKMVVAAQYKPSHL